MELEIELNKIRTMTRNETVRRYGVALVTPLVAPQTVDSGSNAMSELLRDHPEWVSRWWVGVCHTLMETLPEVDPWTRLAAGLPASRLTFDDGCPEPPEVGAYRRDGLPFFGDSADASDLARVTSEDPRLNPDLAAVVTPLSATEAALVGYAWSAESLAQGLAEIIEAVPSLHWDVWAWGVMERVLRRIAFRRLQYASDTGFILAVFEAACHDADDLATGVSSPLSCWALAERGRINDDVYEAIRRANGGSGVS